MHYQSLVGQKLISVTATGCHNHYQVKSFDTSAQASVGLSHSITVICLLFCLSHEAGLLEGPKLFVCFESPPPDTLTPPAGMCPLNAGFPGHSLWLCPHSLLFAEPLPNVSLCPTAHPLSPCLDLSQQLRDVGTYISPVRMVKTLKNREVQYLPSGHGLGQSAFHY